MLKFRILILTFVFFSLAVNAQKRILSAEITFIKPYCGGARPTPEMEADAARKKPYAGETVILVSSKGKVDSVKTDANGSFKKKMKVGKYKLYESWRYYKRVQYEEYAEHYDRKCLENEWNKHFMEITLTKKNTIQVSDGPIYISCPHGSPCITNQLLIPKRE